ncbi:uncharacterized protein LOC127012506 [Drosophila biarmipes]|uniref:uncharacterized protein LOC127012506 n=1 Tax=Drosophila biarmipes TaxID=125945 RepID=UPI0021CD0324|nr:uncharacterized protein LOC127012506 [Drosophila biarmipes]
MFLCRHYQENKQRRGIKQSIGGALHQVQGTAERFLMQSTKENCDAPSPKRKRETSSVWQHFKKTADKAKAICTHSGKTLKTGGNTTNLMDHLKRIHPNYKEENTSDSSKLNVFLQCGVCKWSMWSMRKIRNKKKSWIGTSCL